MNPTPEQKEIIKVFPNLSLLKIEAYAGTGKSSTLRMLSEANPVKSLYIAFNKSIADEAATKFPSHVTCKASHSIAFASKGREMMHKLSRPKGGYRNVAGTASEIAKFYNIPDFPYKDFAGSSPILASSIALMVRNTVRRYEQSSAESLERKHVPMYMVLELRKLRPELLKDALVAEVLKWAKILWKDRCDLSSPVLATHDTYLKLYQLSKPKLNYDIIYLDEAQDTADVVLDIFLNQTHAKLVLVGDSQQAIYEWRGAVNAMSKVEGVTKHLTKSFRFGDEVARVANMIINPELPVKGFEEIPSKLDRISYDEPHTRIYRTNSALLAEAIEHVRAGYRVSCEIDTNDFKKLLESAQALFKKDVKKVKHDSIVPYSDWEELKDACSEEPELNRVAKIIETGMCGDYLDALTHMARKPDADITFTTAHKSKGREWDQVFLAGDFPELNEEGDLHYSERNLLYVAATRAIKVLEVNRTVEQLMGEV